jgi:N1-aminopropylagmatine ureohydrolase
MVHSPPEQNFLGLPPEQSDPSTARVAVLPVPYEGTVSYGGGTAFGPAAIIRASQQVELYDEELRGEPCAIGVATLPPLSVQGIAPSQLAAHIVPAVQGIAAGGRFPILLGGEHSITPPAVEAMLASHPELTVVQFDAHADLRETYEGERMSHACAMARVRERCAAVQVGIRNLSLEEAQWAERAALPIFYAHEMRGASHWQDEALARIATDEIYITFDVDAFDASLMPATGTPEPGGMGWYDAVDFLRLLFAHKRVVGMDIVELAPIAGLHACDFLAAKLAYKCIGFLWQRERRGHS